jgi:hypothetical protein
MTTCRVPEIVPLLSRGKHRNPRKGACFMELVSFLAGERWSDHPACTHPLLGSLARLVNDYTTDARRHRLTALIPNVIGLTSDDPRIDVRIALRSAATALPVVAAERQRVMAVAVVVADRLLDDLDEWAADGLEERSRWALAQVPHAARWAEQFAERNSASVAGFRRHGAPSIVRHAVDGIAHACVADPDGLLYDLLRAAIDDCAARIHRDTSVEAALPDPKPGRLPVDASARQFLAESERSAHWRPRLRPATSPRVARIRR